LEIEHRYLLVEGKAPAGARLRPHNWAERFASNLASYGLDRRLRYSDGLLPVMVEGVKCLLVDRGLESTNPTMFHDILGFAAHFGLAVHGRIEPDLDLPLAS
jgi:hypothetical protein